MSFKDLTFSWYISIGYGVDHEDTVEVSDYFTEDVWNEMSDEDKENWLDEYLLTEISNHLDASIWLND